MKTLKNLDELVCEYEDRLNTFDAFTVETFVVFREIIEHLINTGAVKHNELARNAQISRAYLTDLRRNRRNPSLATMKKIVSALKSKHLEVV